MPSLYTHAKFGEEVLKTLPASVAKQANQYPELFYIGLQGPDILFYYKALSSNKVNRIGYGQHDLPGFEFFEPARKVARRCKNPEAAFSYLAGFICHFTFDTQCHPYIATVEVDKQLSHSEIEVEVDRRLMEDDGRDSLRYLASDQMVPSDFNAEVISWFFPEVTEKEVKKALKGMRLYNKALRSPSKCKRRVLRMGLKKAGKLESLGGLIVNYQENPKCTESTDTIIKLCKAGIPVACKLIVEYSEAVYHKEMELNSRYQRTFGVEK